MMTTIEKKNYLKSKIDSTDDFEILDKIEKIFEENDDVYILSEEQKMRVQEARAEYLKGNFLTEEDANQEMKKWFEEQEKLFGQ